MSRKIVLCVCNLMQLGSIIGLTGIALKRNNDCYKAEVELLDTKWELIRAQIRNEMKDEEIAQLKEELAKFKNKNHDEIS